MGCHHCEFLINMLLLLLFSLSSLTAVTWSSCWAATCTCRGACVSAWLWTSPEDCSTCTAKASSTGTSPPRWWHKHTHFDAHVQYIALAQTDLRGDSAPKAATHKYYMHWRTLNYTHLTYGFSTGAHTVETWAAHSSLCLMMFYFKVDFGNSTGLCVQI